MASNALEAKISKIRQQNEEIRRRHEEVEEDKKNAAKLNALVQMTSSTDWPDRKEPPEFCNTPRSNHKQRTHKEHMDNVRQHIAAGDTKKIHTFAQGEGPPPDPKYNFLADAEREEYNTEDLKTNNGNKGRNKILHGNLKKKLGGSVRDRLHKDNRTFHATHRNECQPEYEAWRAERNRIDEDRISRQRTAEGNWRREWDNDKVHIIDETLKRETRSTLGNFIKKDYKDFDRRHYSDGTDHVNHGRSVNYRLHQGSKNYHSNYDSYNNSYDQHEHDSSHSGSNERTVVATNKSIKVTLNQGNITKGRVMSVKVSSPNIAGTGRVGPRQRARLTYSSQSDVEATGHENVSFPRQKSFEEKLKNTYEDNTQKLPDLKKPYQCKKKENDFKSPYSQRKEFRREDDLQKPHYLPETQKVLKKVTKVSKKECTTDVNSDENIKVLFDNFTCIESTGKDIDIEDGMTNTIVYSDSMMNETKNNKNENCTTLLKNSALMLTKDDTSDVLNKQVDNNKSILTVEEKKDDIREIISGINSQVIINMSTSTVKTVDNKDLPKDDIKSKNIITDETTVLNECSNSSSHDIQSVCNEYAINTNQFQQEHEECTENDVITDDKKNISVKEGITELSVNDSCDNMKNQTIHGDIKREENIKEDSKCKNLNITIDSCLFSSIEEAPFALQTSSKLICNDEVNKSELEEISRNECRNKEYDSDCTNETLRDEIEITNTESRKDQDLLVKE